jgi:tol-pal system protein YbgF
MKNVNIAIILLLLASGCATRKEIVQFKDDTIYLRQQLEALSLENRELQRQLTDINQAIKAWHDDNSQIRPEVLTEIEELKTKIQILESKLDDIFYRAPLLTQSNEIPKTTPDTTVSSVNSVPPSNPAPTAHVDFNSKDIYKTAYLDLSRGNYDLALQGFQAYLTLYPNGELSDNAQYWIGETYYSKGEYKKALDEFNKIITNYSRSKKMAAALLKCGFCSIKLNDLTSARKFLKSVIQDFPNSEEARLAATRMEELKLR